MGGQLLGFNTSYKLIDKVILIASQTGYWAAFKSLNKLKMLSFWYVLIPLLTPIYGYFPSKKMGLFENLPRQMVKEWASWGKRKNYMMYYHNKTEYFFDALNLPMLALSFSKDNFAPKNAVDWLANEYKNAQVNRIHHSPKKGENHVRHFGFFKSSFKEPFWEQTHLSLIHI